MARKDKNIQKKEIPDRVPPARKTPEQTVVRPPIVIHTCDCNNSDEVANNSAVIFTASGLGSLGAAWRDRRIKIEIGSQVECDVDTHQCKYTYTATASVQQQVRRRWLLDRRKRAFVNSFTVHDGVNETVTPDRIDRPSVSVVTWNPNSPLKQSTPVTLIIAPSTRGGNRITITQRPVVICVPTGPVATCPVP